MGRKLFEEDFRQDVAKRLKALPLARKVEEPPVGRWWAELWAALLGLFGERA